MKKFPLGEIFPGRSGSSFTKLLVQEATGMALAHNIAGIKLEEFKGPASQKGHVLGGRL